MTVLGRKGTWGTTSKLKLRMLGRVVVAAAVAPVVTAWFAPAEDVELLVPVVVVDIAPGLAVLVVAGAGLVAAPPCAEEPLAPLPVVAMPPP